MLLHLKFISIYLSISHAQFSKNGFSVPESEREPPLPLLSLPTWPEAGRLSKVKVCVSQCQLVERWQHAPCAFEKSQTMSIKLKNCKMYLLDLSAYRTNTK